MILSNRLLFIDCAGCGGRYEAKPTAEPFGTPCPSCGHAPEVNQ